MDDDFFNFEPATSSDYIVPADTSTPPITANASSSSGGFGGILDTVKQYGGTLLDAAKTYAQFETARGAQSVQLDSARAALETQRSKAVSDQQVALLSGQAAVAAAQAKANTAQIAADRAAQGSFVDRLSSGSYNSLIIVLTLAGLGFAYLQSVQSHE